MQLDQGFARLHNKAFFKVLHAGLFCGALELLPRTVVARTHPVQSTIVARVRGRAWAGSSCLCVSLLVCDCRVPACVVLATPTALLLLVHVLHASHTLRCNYQAQVRNVYFKPLSHTK